MNKQYIMSLSDIDKFKKVKESSLYKDYINTIINSPILLNIANDHIKHVDITEDMEFIIGKTPNAKKLNTLFKDTLKNMAINIVADTLILKDIVDVSFENSTSELEIDFKIKYLMGLADETFYEKAKLVIDKNPDTSSLIYIGYAEYKKRLDKNTLNKFNLLDEFKLKTTEKSIKKTTTTPKEKPIKIDINSNDIDL